MCLSYYTGRLLFVFILIFHFFPRNTCRKIMIFTTDTIQVYNESRLMWRGNYTYFPRRGAQSDSLKHSQRRRNQFCPGWNPGGQKSRNVQVPPPPAPLKLDERIEVNIKVQTLTTKVST